MYPEHINAGRGGLTYETLSDALVEFKAGGPPAVWVTEDYCRAIFAKGNAVAKRDPGTGKTLAELRPCNGDGLSC